MATNRGSFSSLGSVDTDKIDVLRAALLVAAPDTRQRARLLSVLAGELAWHPDHELRVATADDAVTAARRTGDPATLLFAILQPGPADWIPETSAQRVRLLREAAALADRIADRHSYFGAQLLLATYLLESGSAERVDDTLDALVAAAADVHEPFTRWISRYVRGCQALAHGELARAEQDMDAARSIARSAGMPEADPAYLEQLFLLRRQQGRLAEIVEELRDAEAHMPNIATRWCRRAEVAYSEVAAGDPQRARTMLGETARDGFASFYGAPWLGGMCLWADVVAELGEHEDGQVVYAALLPWRHMVGTCGPLPVHAVSLALGRLAALAGDAIAAGRHFDEAARVHASVHCPFGEAETALHWGRWLLTCDPERSRLLLSDAAARAERYGFATTRRRAEQELARS